MRNFIKAVVAVAALVLATSGLAACTSQADTANHNLSKACENFECLRRVIGINGITDKVLFEVTGFCSYETEGQTYDVICKNPDGSVQRTTMAKSDNVTIVVTQLESKNVDLFRPRIIFRPETIVPDFDLSTSANP